MKKRLFFLMVCILFTASMTHANLLVNGGFEAPWTGGAGSWQDFMYKPYGPELGWDFTNSGGIGVSKSWSAWGGPAYGGSQFAFIQGPGRAPSSVSIGDNMFLAMTQAFTLTSNSDVELSFYMMLRPNYPAGQRVVVGLDGKVIAIFDSPVSWEKKTLNLGVLPAGSHTLALGGTGYNGKDTSAYLDNVNLQATPTPPVNSAPVVAPKGSGVYQVNTPVILGGQVLDADGDALSYHWLEGETVLFKGTIPSTTSPYTLTAHVIEKLGLGVHTLTLVVSDGVNKPVSASITVEVIDNIAPVLNPDPDKTILWPPNNKMVPVTIIINANKRHSATPLQNDAYSNSVIRG